jgi:hypothetical protein
MTAYGTSAPGALSRALIDIVSAHLDARAWRARPSIMGIDWHHEQADARIALRPGLLLVYRRGARVLYLEDPRTYDIPGALERAGVATPRTRAASAAGRARVPRAARAAAGAPWVGARGSGGS